MNVSTFVVIHAGERIDMAGDLACSELIIHLGLPVTRIDVRGHRLTWLRLEVLGRGVAEIVDGDRLLHSWSTPVSLGAGG